MLYFNVIIYMYYYNMLHSKEKRLMTVEPIRYKAKIKQMYQYLNGKDPKYGLIFKFGLNTGMRMSDFLP